MTEIAYAKINLALHIRKRRKDGYHDLETLFAFVDDGDRLDVQLPSQSSPACPGAGREGGGPPAGWWRGPTRPPEVLPADRWDPSTSFAGPPPSRPAPGQAGEELDALTLEGEFAELLDRSSDNIVMVALDALPHATPWTIHLDKRLPVAAGLGGGSADAGAIFRLVERASGLPEGWEQIAAGLGADVPACVTSRTTLGHGTGTDLTPGPQDLAGCPVLLVNPRLPLSTGPVFMAWDDHDRGALPTGTAREIALAGRNDLEAPAITLCPVIADVLAALRDTAPWLARMSGSGATCFALYDDADERDVAAGQIAARHPAWWQMTGALR